jgi:hypothetical protein
MDYLRLTAFFLATFLTVFFAFLTGAGLMSV